MDSIWIIATEGCPLLCVPGDGRTTTTTPTDDDDRPTDRPRPPVTLGVTLRWMDRVDEMLGSETMGIDVSQHAVSIFDGFSSWGGIWECI